MKNINKEEVKKVVRCRSCAEIREILPKLVYELQAHHSDFDRYTSMMLWGMTAVIIITLFDQIVSLISR